MFPIIAAGLAGIVIFCGVVFVMVARGKKGDDTCEPVPDHNRRKEPRVPVTSDFDLYWQDVDASHKSARAKGIEISEHGASVRCPKPILRNSVIQVRGCQIQLETKATVKYCTKKGLSYVIGLELETQSNAQLKTAIMRA
jgi:PilZ domain-containing protein